MKQGIWKSDWFVGLLITLVIVIFSGTALIQGLERWAYDFGVRASTRIPSDKVAVIAIDPSRRKTGGALLGDRIRMNAISASNVYMRSIATRASGQDVPWELPDIVAAVKAATSFSAIAN